MAEKNTVNQLQGTHPDKVIGKTKWPQINETYQETRMKWTGHMLRMVDKRNHKRIVKYQSGGKKRILLNDLAGRIGFGGVGCSLPTTFVGLEDLWTIFNCKILIADENKKAEIDEDDEVPGEKIHYFSFVFQHVLISS